MSSVFARALDKFRLKLISFVYSAGGRNKKWMVDYEFLRKAINHNLVALFLVENTLLEANFLGESVVVLQGNNC